MYNNPIFNISHRVNSQILVASISFLEKLKQEKFIHPKQNRVKYKCYRVEDRKPTGVH